MPQNPARLSLVQRVVFSIPVLGWMLRDVARGGEQELLWFAATLAFSLACATMIFGLPGLVAGMLIMTVLALTAIVLITFG
jgi:hypothetical protein